MYQFLSLADFSECCKGSYVPTASENVFGKTNRLGVNTVIENRKKACESLAYI